MHESKIDIVGWALAIGIVVLAFFIAFKDGSEVGVAIAIALLTLVIIEKRRNKIISASLIQISDSGGAIRGLIGFDGSGIQLGVRTDQPASGSVAYRSMWQTKPNVAFTFQASTSFTSSGVMDVAPEILVRGRMQYEIRSFAMQFNYDTKAMKPAIHVTENDTDGIHYRDIKIS